MFITVTGDGFVMNYLFKYSPYCQLWMLHAYFPSNKASNMLVFSV